MAGVHVVLPCSCTFIGRAAHAFQSEEGFLVNVLLMVVWRQFGLFFEEGERAVTLETVLFILVISTYTASFYVLNMKLIEKIFTHSIELGTCFMAGSD